MTLAVIVHVIAAIIWVGGMFFAHFVLRPSLSLLEPPLRLRFMLRIFGGFFPWVWLAILSIFASGYWMLLVGMKHQPGFYVQLMQGIGWLMAVIFCYIYFFLFRSFKVSMENKNIKTAAARVGRIRILIGVNLVLGMIAVFVGISSIIH